MNAKRNESLILYTNAVEKITFTLQVSISIRFEALGVYRQNKP